MQQLLYSLPPGSSLQHGTYRIERVLGEGGFGITYQAMRKDGQLLAIKELFPRGSARLANNMPIWPNDHPRLWFEQIRELFLDEVRLLVPIQHPNIVRVHDCFHENDTAYMVMELVRGRTLSTYVKARGPLAPQEALRFLAQLGLALEVVHKRGLVHRDVKSENVLVDEQQRAVLIDFGSVQPTHEASAQGDFSVVSHGFSPPELYSYKKNYRPSVDIYSLAAVAYNLMSGQVPTPAPERLKGRPIESIRSFNKLITAPLEQAVLRGLSLNPSDRPITASAFVRGLTNPSLSTGPISTPIPAPAPPMPRAVHLVETLEGHQSTINSLAFSPDGRLLVSSCLECVRFWEPTSARNLFTLSEKQVNRLQFAPNSQKLWLGTGRGSLKHWQMSSGQVELLCAPILPEKYPLGIGALSGQGQTWAFVTHEGRIQTWDGLTGRPHPLLEPLKTGVQAITVNDQGEYLGVVRQDGKVMVLEVKQAEALGIRTNHQQIIKRIAFQPRTSQLVCADAQGGLLLWDWRGGKEQLLRGEGLVASQIQFHPKQLLFGLISPVAPFWEFWVPGAAGSWVQQTPSLVPPSPIQTFTFHPDQPMLATAHSDGKIRLWKLS